MELHDIFSPVEPVEYSLYGFMAILLTIFLLGYIALRLWKKKRKGIAYYLKILENYPQEDAKTIAYKLNHYGQHIIKTDAQKRALETLITELIPYRYEKEGTPLPLEIAEQLKDFFAQVRQENV